MNGTTQSRLRHPLTRLYCLVLIILAAPAVFTLAIAPVNAQTVVNICSRTAEVQTAILDNVSGATCSTITDTQLAGIQYLYTDGYSNTAVVPSDFANLTGLIELGIWDSSALTTVPANAYSEVTGYTNLINVNLVGNAITDVHTDAFDGLTQITTISLRNNSIETLEPGVFDGLASLTTLVLTNNRIQFLEDDIFAGLTSLTKLWLDDNGLKRIDKDIFGELPLLEILYLSSNDLSDLDAGSFNGLSNLKQLSLDGNGISNLPVGTFNGLADLQQLYLGGNRLSTLDAGIFDGLAGLTHLYLNNNRIAALDADIFDGLTDLETLDLHGNNISSLPTNIFEDLDVSLTSLALNINRIATLDADIFDGLTGLQYLYLNNNSLSTLDAGIFDGPSGLLYLYLSNNSLPTLDADIFDGLTNLQRLYLNNNSLSTLDADIFDGLIGLQYLYLSNNSLPTLDADIFDGLTGLLYLYLNHNSLSALDADIFDGLANLQRLYLDNNSLSALDADIFDGLANLQRLYLNHNSLSALPADIFDDLDASLLHLVLTKNTVATLPSGIFTGLSGLKGLDLSCNTLTALDLTRFDPFASTLSFLDISGNSFNPAPTELELQAKLTNTDLNLYIGTNTVCLPPYEAGLSDLSVSTGTLFPAFLTPGTDVYTLAVGHDVSSLTVSVTPTDPRATIEPRNRFAYDNDENTLGIQVDLTQRTNIGWQVRVGNGAFASLHQINVYRDLPPASEPRLHNLELSGVTLAETFDKGTQTYMATTAGRLTETTVTATPLDPDATAVIKVNGTVDADGTVDLLAPGTYVITVEVTAEDGTTMRTYTVTFTIMGTISGGGGGGGGAFVGGGGGGGGPTPSDVDFEWNITRDIEELHRDHGDPTGLWSDGATLWILQNGDGADDAIYAYDLESGERVEEREFELDNGNLAPRGVWSDRTAIWVSDSGQNRLFTHDLATGERLPDSDLALHPDNDDPRGIWSDGSTMWVLDGRADALFAYDLATGELLAEYALDDDNDDPHGIWSDETTVWVSDHGAKRLFAYRLPVLDEVDESAEGDARELDRVTDEEFRKLSGASNNSPRGIWSDGDVMYVVDASDGKVYSYNMPDAIDARLDSLTLSDVDIGEFSPGRPDYEAVVADGVTETTVEAEAAQDDAVVEIAPADADEDADGDQIAVEGGVEITVTVTSPDESRTKVYHVRIGEAGPSANCLRGAVTVGFSLVVYGGGSVEDLAACAQSRHVTAIYVLHEGEYVPYTLGAPDLVNEEFVALYPDGLPALTPLIAKSEGPPSADPAAEGEVTEPWPECLRGEIATGFSLVLHEGGSVEDLEACAQSLDLDALYALHEGAYVSYILGAPDFANAAFAELFADGVPAVTPLVAKSDSPFTASAD